MRFGKVKKLMRQVGREATADKSWQLRQREVILSAVRRSQVWEMSSLSSVERPAWILRWGTAFLAVILVFSAFIGTVSAARSSLPGDVFYPVKIGWERAQIGLALSPEKKAELEIAFAGNRLQEVKEIIARKDKAPAAAANINQAINRFNQGLAAVQKRVESSQTAKVPTLVNDKTAALEESLLNLKDKVTVKQALDKVDETNAKSLEVIVEKAAASPDKQAKEEALAKLQTKVEKIEKSVSSLLLERREVTQGSSTASELLEEASQIKPEEAKKSLEEAKKILSEKDVTKLEDVLSKVQEAQEKIKGQ